jgi:hypothetical protein
MVSFNVFSGSYQSYCSVLHRPLDDFALEILGELSRAEHQTVSNNRMAIERLIVDRTLFRGIVCGYHSSRHSGSR